MPETVAEVLAEMMRDTGHNAAQRWYIGRITSAHAAEVAAIRTDERMKYADFIEPKIHEIEEKDATIEALQADVGRHHVRCDCGCPSRHEDTVNICCDCGGYRP